MKITERQAVNWLIANGVNPGEIPMNARLEIDDMFIRITRANEAPWDQWAPCHTLIVNLREDFPTSIPRNTQVVLSDYVDFEAEDE